MLERVFFMCQSSQSALHCTRKTRSTRGHEARHAPMGDHEFEFFGCGGCRKSVTMTSNVFERHPCLNTRSATRQQSPFGLRILGTQDACSDISNRGILSMMFLSLLSTVVGAPVVHKLTNDKCIEEHCQAAARKPPGVLRQVRSVHALGDNR